MVTQVDPEVVGLDKDMQEDSVEPETCEKKSSKPALNDKVTAEQAQRPRECGDWQQRRMLEGEVYSGLQGAQKEGGKEFTGSCEEFTVQLKEKDSRPRS